MVHKGTKVLATQHLMLKRFAIDDAEAMFRNWANDPDVTRFLSWEPHGSIAVTKDLLKTWAKEYENQNCYNWAVVFNDDLVGSVGLLNLKDDICEAEVGYCISKDFWGMGIMAEALSAVIKYAFDEVGFHRIFAKHDVDNPNSGKVMKKCGMNYIETKNAPLALTPDKIILCDCYELFNPNMRKNTTHPSR